MDAASSGERALVASHLWAAGISAEYLPQSSAVLKLFKQSSQESSKLGELSSDWNSEEIFGVCGLFKIPFVVIVQPHLLKDKGAVRLRQVLFDAPGQTFNSGSEEFISLSALAETMKHRLESMSFADDKGSDGDLDLGLAHDRHGTTARSATGKDLAHTGPKSNFSSQIDFIYVDSDQYYVGEKLSKSDRSDYIAVKKMLRTISQKAKTFLNDLVNSKSVAGGQGPLIIAVDMPFFVVRDFGTSIMIRGESHTLEAKNELTERHPKYKKVLKTLFATIETLARRRDRSNSKDEVVDVGVENTPAYMFVYSIIDEQFDLITLFK